MNYIGNSDYSEPLTLFSYLSTLITNFEKKNETVWKRTKFYGKKIDF